MKTFVRFQLNEKTTVLDGIQRKKKQFSSIELISFCVTFDATLEGLCH